MQLLPNMITFIGKQHALAVLPALQALTLQATTRAALDGALLAASYPITDVFAYGDRYEGTAGLPFMRKDVLGRPFGIPPIPQVGEVPSLPGLGKGFPSPVLGKGVPSPVLGKQIAAPELTQKLSVPQVSKLPLLPGLAKLPMTAKLAPLPQTSKAQQINQITQFPPLGPLGGKIMNYQPQWVTSRITTVS